MNIDKKEKRRKILWVISGIFGFFGVMLFLFSDFTNIGELSFKIGSFLLLFSIIAIVINIKFYNSILFLVTLLLLAMFFKFMHWPGAGPLFTMTLGLLSIFSVIALFKYFKNKNPFLKWIGFSANIILPIINLTLLFKIMHWPRFDTIEYIGTFLFVILILAMVFTLPNSKYLEWTKVDKKMFYRSIIIPMTFIFIITSMSFLAEDTLKYVFGGAEPKQTFNLHEVYIVPHEGIADK